MYENMSVEQLKEAIESRKQWCRDNKGSSECSEEHAPAIHYMTQELEKRAAKS